MVEVSVIIPTLKSREDIACIPIFEQDKFSDYEVIVRGDIGASKARNEGIKRADADKLVFLDDDSYPEKGYLAEASKSLGKEEAVAGRIIHPYDDIFSKFTTYYDYGDQPLNVDKLVGCNMAIRREVVETVGLFDEDFLWGHEDSEFSYRVKKMYDIYYNPDLVVRHSYAESVFDLWKKHYQLETHRSLFWEKQNIPKSERILRLAWRLIRPSDYIGETFSHTAVKTGKNIASNLGRVKGTIDNDFRENVPVK